MIDKSQMTEEEIKLNYITPAILENGQDKHSYGVLFYKWSYYHCAF